MDPGVMRKVKRGGSGKRKRKKAEMFFFWGPNGKTAGLLVRKTVLHSLFWEKKADSMHILLSFILSFSFLSEKVCRKRNLESKER